MNYNISLHIRPETLISVRKGESGYQWLDIDGHVQIHIKRADIDRLKEQLNKLYNESED